MLVHMFNHSGTRCRTLLPARRWREAMTSDADSVRCRACIRLMAGDVERIMEQRDMQDQLRGLVKDVVLDRATEERLDLLGKLFGIKRAK